MGGKTPRGLDLKPRGADAMRRWSLRRVAMIPLSGGLRLLGHPEKQLVDAWDAISLENCPYSCKPSGPLHPVTLETLHGPHRAPHGLSHVRLRHVPCCPLPPEVVAARVVRRECGNLALAHSATLLLCAAQALPFGPRTWYRRAGAACSSPQMLLCNLDTVRLCQWACCRVHA